MTLIYLEGRRITMAELEQVLENLSEDGEVIVLDWIDKRNGALHFEINKYGIYY